ncbi:hypothetical protein L6Q96_03510 [Candidatus Binatia bacterium]|nr:hypothetical protein [Candidatus Binatia bacterium]
MKVSHGGVHAYEEVAVYEYVNEYEYGGEAGLAAPAGGVPNQSLHATAGPGPFCRIEAAPRARRA